MEVETEPKGATIVVVYNNDPNRTKEQFVLVLNELFSGNIIYLKEWLSKDLNSVSKRFLVCIPKYINDLVSKDTEMLKELQIHINIYKRRKNNSKQNNFTFIPALHIPTETEKVQDLFSHLEKYGMISPNTYKVVTPEKYPNGEPRNYTVVFFTENERGIVSQSFVEKIKLLIDNSEFNGNNFKVNWLKKKPFFDIKKGENKEKRSDFQIVKGNGPSSMNTN